MITRVGMPLLVSSVQLCAAALALGPPDLGPALAFLGGGWPTVDETLSALQLMVWAIVVGAAAWSLAELVRELGRHAAGSRRFRQGSTLVTGLLILLAGG
ncbi:MAG TPA: hypothetical protein VLW53_20660, partial [Candidatus Eisenbacteria bacterium]|nr:hypothetical protein [Candidatus Eisenbacteria bacterium]